MNEHNHEMAQLTEDLAKKVGPAVGRVTGHWPGGNDWQVFACEGCGFAAVHFDSGIKLRARVNVRGWNLPTEKVPPPSSAS